MLRNIAISEEGLWSKLRIDVLFIKILDYYELTITNRCYQYCDQKETSQFIHSLNSVDAVHVLLRFT